MTISQLKVGQTATIIGYTKGGDTVYRNKLLSMGLTKGTRITITKTAPFGDPVEIQVRDFKLSLRKTEAEILILE